MSLRSWLIRGLILAVLTALGVAAWVAGSWVSPDRVRAQVLATLDEQFQGVDVHVGYARMRIFGGIAVTDLRLTRRDDPSGQPFLVVPAAVLYHDKEQLNRGRLVIRKVELDSPALRLDRRADGTWSLAGVLRPAPADKPVPTFVARGGTVTVTDRAPNGFPDLRLADTRFSLLNDPLPVLTAKVEGAAAGFGPVQARARVNRVTGQLSLGVELADLPLGPATAALVGRFAPDAAPHLAKLTAKHAGVKADISYQPDATPAWRHDLTAELTEGRFEHASLPWPVEHIRAVVRSVDGRVKVEKALAKVGPAAVELSLETRSQETGDKKDEAGDPLARVESAFQRLAVTARGVPLTAEVCDALPDAVRDRAAKLRRQFRPVGVVDLSYTFAREPGGWRRVFETTPRQLRVEYEKFRYPVEDVAGTVRKTATHAAPEVVSLDLTGRAGGRPVTLRGTVTGDGPDPGLDLRIEATDVPVDDRLFAALPGKFPGVVRKFRAGGRADVVALISQQPGVNLSENEFQFTLRDGVVNYTAFPYPVEKVRGRLVVKVAAADPTRPLRNGRPEMPPPDRDEVVFEGFTGVHNGGTIWLSGSKRQVPGTADRVLRLAVGGNGCPVDDDLRAAAAALDMADTWETFAPRGRLTFTSDLEILDRGAPPGEDAPPFDPAADLKVTFNFHGPTVIPAFFPYEMTDLSGWLEYRAGKVDLAHLSARHDDARLRLTAGDVRFYPGGVVWANLGGLEMKPVVPDAAFLRALPAKLRSGVEDLQFRGGADMTVKHLVVLTPPKSENPSPALPEVGRGLSLAPLSPSGRGAGGEGTAPTRAGGKNRGGGLPLTPNPSPRRGEGDQTVRSPVHPFTRSAPVVSARGQAPGSNPPGPTLPTPPEPDAVVYWDMDLKLTGAALNVGVPCEELHGTLGCRGRYEGTHLGLVRGNLWLDRAVVAKQPLATAKAGFRHPPQQPDPGRPGQFRPSEVEVLDVAGSLFRGTVGGEARVVLADPPRYDLWLTAAGVQLDEVARHYQLGHDADLKGEAQAQLRVYNRPDPRTGAWAVEGFGRVDVPSGRMYNLPVLLDLVKVLKLQAPDKTAFEEAHASFRLAGDRIKVDQLDLIGTAACLGGSGELDLTGEYVKFEFYVLWSKLLARLATTPVGDLTAFFSKSLFKIKMTRKDGALHYDPEMVPLVTDPVKNVVERVKTQAGRVVGK